MPKLPKSIYGRANWKFSSAMIDKYGQPYREPATYVWIPDSKLRLRDAVAMLGKMQISGWNGSEPAARRFRDPPERPWLQYGDREDGYLIFDDEGNQESVDEATAEAWWSEIKTDLLAEWQAEQDAVERWEKAVHAFRSLLAEKKLASELLTDSGKLIVVDSTEWLTLRARAFFRIGVGLVSVVNGFEVFKFSGALLIDRVAMERILSGKTETEAQQAPATEPDPAAFPYLTFMLRAAREIPFDSSGRTPKKIIERWLSDNWPAGLGESTQTKIQTMATFLRRPEDEAGGIHRSKPAKAPDR